MAKYAAKFDSTVIGTRYTATKGIATDAFNLTDPVMAGFETQVKADILPTGSPTIPSFLIPAYLAYMRQCYSMSRKYGGATLALEAQAQHDVWVARGLQTAVLIKIAALFGATVS